MNFRKTLLDAPIKPRKLTVRNNKNYLEPNKDTITRTISTNTLCTTKTYPKTTY